jgi:hypothetical protein
MASLRSAAKVRVEISLELANRPMVAPLLMPIAWRQAVGLPFDPQGRYWAAVLEVDKLLLESRAMGGALGAMAYGILKGMEVGGAEVKALAAVRVLLQDNLQKVSDADCNVICEVVFRRLQEDQARGQPWYP